VIAPPRTSTLVRVAVMTVLAGCALSAVTAGLIYGSVTGVSDATRRAAALQRVHGARPARITRGERVARAIVAVEDKRFWKHGALDPLAIGRVVLTTLRGGGVDPGGSTIAVQLAKVLYPSRRDRSPARSRRSRSRSSSRTPTRSSGSCRCT